MQSFRLPTPAGEIVFTIRIEIADNQLTSHDFRGSYPSMEPVLSQLREADRGVPDPVVARLDRTQTHIEAFVDRWLDYLIATGRSVNTIRAWRPMVAADIREAGWRTPEDLTLTAVTGHLSRLREERGWSIATYNAHLAALKSLRAHWDRTRKDELAAAQGLMGDSVGQGARAATLEEARAHIRAALEQQINDRRTRAPRALYLLCLFGAGCREAEPGIWRWKHLRLDGPVPFVAWEPSIQKNKRKAHIAISLELAEKLREWRTRTPHGPDDLVFPIKPPRAVWHRDRERAGIDYQDNRDRPYTPHASRKFFRTMLTTLGVNDRLAEHMMRHAGGVAARYQDPTLEEQAAALKDFPRLWPDLNGDTDPRYENRGPNPLTPRGGIADDPDVQGVRDGDHTQQPGDRPSVDPMRGPEQSCTDVTEGRSPGGFGGPVQRRDPVDPITSLKKVGASDTIRMGSTDRAAEILRAVATLLDVVNGVARERGGHDDDEREDPGVPVRSIPPKVG